MHNQNPNSRKSQRNDKRKESSQSKSREPSPPSSELNKGKTAIRPSGANKVRKLDNDMDTEQIEGVHIETAQQTN